MSCQIKLDELLTIASETPLNREQRERYEQAVAGVENSFTEMAAVIAEAHGLAHGDADMDMGTLMVGFSPVREGQPFKETFKRFDPECDWLVTPMHTAPGSVDKGIQI